METGRDIFKQFLNGAPSSRPAFVPLIRGLMSRVEGVPMEALTQDATAWANCLVKTHQLFRFDGVVVGLDFSLMAEACGCDIRWANDRPVIHPPSCLCETPEENGRMKHALEAAGRVFDVSRNHQACVGVMTGPVTLASMLFGREAGPDHINDVKPLVVQATEAFCKRGPDMLLFMEGRPLTLAEPAFAHRKLYNTLRNIAGYYDIPTGLYLEGFEPGDLARFSSLKMDVYVPGPARDNSLPVVSELRELGRGALGVGVGLPLDDLHTARGRIRDAMDRYSADGGRGLFFTSSGPATRGVDLATLHTLVNDIFNA